MMRVEEIGKIDLVNVFRAPGVCSRIVHDVIRLKIPYLWLQEGVIHDEAAGLGRGCGHQGCDGSLPLQGARSCWALIL